MLNKAYELLKNRYDICRDKVIEKEYYVNFAEEKMHHSMQVYGLGKFIFKHEFAGKSQEFKELALTAVLLHDIGRFKEIEELCKIAESGGHTEKFDHGTFGYEELIKIPDFNDIRITLPVKHHGHMIEEFYNDEEYKKIEDEELKKNIEDIIFLVRDADKMANLYFFVDAPSYEETMLYKLDILPLPKEKQTSPISSVVFEDFMNEKVIKNSDVSSGPDQIMRFLAWLYDINYKTSYDYFLRHNLLKKYINFLIYYKVSDKQSFIIEKKINNYINEMYEHLKGQKS